MQKPWLPGQCEITPFSGRLSIRAAERQKTSTMTNKSLHGLIIMTNDYNCVTIYKFNLMMAVKCNNATLVVTQGLKSAVTEQGSVEATRTSE